MMLGARRSVGGPPLLQAMIALELSTAAVLHKTVNLTSTIDIVSEFPAHMPITFAADIDITFADEMRLALQSYFQAEVTMAVGVEKAQVFRWLTSAWDDFVLSFAPAGYWRFSESAEPFENLGAAGAGFDLVSTGTSGLLFQNRSLIPADPKAKGLRTNHSLNYFSIPAFFPIGFKSQSSLINQTIMVWARVYDTHSGASRVLERRNNDNTTVVELLLSGGSGDTPQTLPPYADQAKTSFSRDSVTANAQATPIDLCLIYRYSHDNSDISLDVNGVKYTGTWTGPPLSDPGQPTTIANSAGDLGIQSLTMWDRVLTDEEVDSLWETGNTEAETSLWATLTTDVSIAALLHARSNFVAEVVTNVSATASTLTVVAPQTMETLLMGYGPVAYWQHGEASGNFLNTVNSSTWAAVPSGDVQRQYASLLTNETKKCAYYNYAYSSVTPVSKINSNWTIVVWCRPHYTTSYNNKLLQNRIYGSTYINAVELICSSSNSGKAHGRIRSYGTNYTIIADTAIPTDTTRLIVFRILPSQLKLFVNGVHKTQDVTFGYPDTDLSQPIRISEQYTEIQDMALYNRSLTDAEIDAIWALR